MVGPHIYDYSSSEIKNGAIPWYILIMFYSFETDRMDVNNENIGKRFSHC